jgi:hypothetical protein
MPTPEKFWPIFRPTCWKVPPKQFEFFFTFAQAVLRTMLSSPTSTDVRLHLTEPFTLRTLRPLSLNRSSLTIFGDRRLAVSRFPLLPPEPPRVAETLFSKNFRASSSFLLRDPETPFRWISLLSPTPLPSLWYVIPNFQTQFFLPIKRN